MAKKPIRIYRTGVPAEAQQQVQQAPAAQQRPPTSSRARVPVYQDGGNRDRMSITQQVVEYSDSHKAKLAQGVQSRYEQLLECIYDAVLITDAAGNIREVNDRAEHAFMWTKKELCDINIVHLISGADERLMEIVRQNAENKRYTVLEAVCVCGDESRFHAEIVVNRLTDTELAFFVRDVTQRKKTEEELKAATEKLIEAEKVQSRLDTLSTLFYELNNPLQILTCMAELDKNDEYRKQLQRIVAVLDHLKKQGPLETVVDEEVGTRFHVPPSPAELQQLDKSKILVVDDEAMLADMFVSALKTAFADRTVISASDGKKAVEAFVAERPGLIVMDISMPVMSGEQAFEEIRKICGERRWALPAMVFCTGFVVSDTLQAIVNEDASRTCLSKPLSINDLIEAVRRLLSV